MRWLTTLLLLAACDSGSSAPDMAEHLTATTSIVSQGIGNYEVESHVATNDYGDVVVAWIGINSSYQAQIGYAVSHDDGQTWLAPQLITGNLAVLNSDPTLDVDGFGNFYASWVGFSDQVSGHVLVTKLGKGQNTFAQPVEASTGAQTFFDKPWVVVAPNDDVFVTYSNISAGGDVVFARSTDHGATFSRTDLATQGGNLAFSCVDPLLGDVYVVYVVQTTATAFNLFARKSTDHGASFAAAANPLATDSTMADPGCVARGGDLWVVYANGNSPSSEQVLAPATAIRVIHHSLAPDASVVVSDGPAGTQFLFPQIAMEPSGDLDVTYLKAGANNTASVERSHSIDGKTWTHSTIGAGGQFAIGRGGMDTLGDYMGLVATRRYLYTSFADNTSGASHIRFARTPTE